MKPLGRNIIIDPIITDTKQTEKGLLLSADKGDDRYKRARIESVGQSVTGVTPGDVIWYDSFAANKIVFENGYIKQVIKDLDIIIVEDAS